MLDATFDALEKKILTLANTNASLKTELAACKQEMEQSIQKLKAESTQMITSLNAEKATLVEKTNQMQATFEKESQHLRDENHKLTGRLTQIISRLESLQMNY